MRPIEQRTDVTFGQALKCLSFRIPNRKEHSDSSFGLALGLRYGLLGTAAAHHLFLTCPDKEEHLLIRVLSMYESLVKEHMQAVVIPRLSFEIPNKLAEKVACYASEPMQQFLPIYRQLCPIELALSVLSDQFSASHRKDILAGTNFFKRAGLKRNFQRGADQSFLYALSFFERRQLDIDEVKEIALIGE